MSILNVRDDYGAVGDGSTDDTNAIQSAIDDAAAGDTVLIPETTDYYRVTSADRAAVELDAAADNITITGEGPGSEIRLDREDYLVSPMGTDHLENATWTSITIQKLRFNADKSNNADGHAFSWGSDADVTGLDITMEDCIFEDAPRSGLAFGGNGTSRVTVRRCTARNCDNHGFNPIGTEEGTASDPECRFFDCKSVNNNGVGLDFHTGNHLLDGYYGDNNRNGTKGGESFGPINHMTVRNANFRNSRNIGFYTSIPDDSEYTVIFDTVEIVGADDYGLRIEDASDWTFEGPVFADGCGTGDPDRNIFITNSATLDASGATVYSQNAGSGAGLFNYSGGSSTVGTLQHYNNPDGAYNDPKGTLSIDSTTDQEAAGLDVPGANDVGAFSGSDSTDDSTETAPLFDDWSPRWGSDRDDWSVSGSSSNVEDSILELNASSSGRHVLSCDTIGSATDVDILGLMRVPSNDDDASSYCRLVGRGAGTTGNETGYFVSFRDVPTFEMVKYVDGNSTLLASQSIDSPVGTWLYVRFNISGDTLRARYWQYGGEEPDDWTLAVTDPSITGSGWVGAGGWSTDTQQWDVFSVGTAGESAQFLNRDSSPTVTWQNPVDGEIVSGTATIGLGASDLEDSDDSMDVEYRIDGNSWRTASYSSETESYEDSWETSNVTDGDHSLEARATDSNGNADTSTIAVTTDNTAIPVVENLSLSEVETDSSDAEFDADWEVSDTDDDLDTVDFSLTQESTGDIEDTTTVDIGGNTAGGSTRLLASGDDGTNENYLVTLTVSDSNGNTASATASTTETETNNPPSIDRFSVSEAGLPDPHAEITAVWNVSDADGDLSSVEIAIANSGDIVQSVLWQLSGTQTSDMDTFRIKNGDGQSFDVNLTVTDGTGESTTEAMSLTV